MSEQRISAVTVVTATHPGHGSETVEIEDDYVLVCDGTAHRHNITVRKLQDGTETHTITVRGIRPKR